MFGLFKKLPFRDAELGQFVRFRGNWHGKMILGKECVPLVIAGNKNEPDSSVLALAKQIPYALRQPLIESTLFAHYEPYAEALAAGGCRCLPSPSCRSAGRRM